MPLTRAISWQSMYSEIRGLARNVTRVWNGNRSSMDWEDVAHTVVLIVLKRTTRDIDFRKMLPHPKMRHRFFVNCAINVIRNDLRRRRRMGGVRELMPDTVVVPDANVQTYDIGDEVAWLSTVVKSDSHAEFALAVLSGQETLHSYSHAKSLSIRSAQRHLALGRTKLQRMLSNDL